MRVGVVNGIIYAIGGYDGSAHLNTVECFDPMTNAWKPVASMASRRSSAGVAVLNDMLYVVGKSVDISFFICNPSPLPLRMGNFTKRVRQNCTL